MAQPPPLMFPPEYQPQQAPKQRRVQLQAPSRNPSDIPIPTNRAPPRRTPSNAAHLKRAKTLTRPERGVAPAPLINPPAPLMSSEKGAGAAPPKPPSNTWDTWRITSYIFTWWAPAFLLSSLGGMKDQPTRQAWREKVTLCIIALLMGSTVGFATIGLDRWLCPKAQGFNSSQFQRINTTDTLGTVGIRGWMFNVSNSDTIPFNFYAPANKTGGVDITPNFTRLSADFERCKGLNFHATRDELCSTASPCVLGRANETTFKQEIIFNMSKLIGYDWDQVARFKNFMVLDGAVLNLAPYIAANPAPILNDPVDRAIRTVLFNQSVVGGKDATRLFYNKNNLKRVIPCLQDRYFAGFIDKLSPRCFIAQLLLYVSLLVIMGVVLARFVMACLFNWFISRSLVATPKDLNRRVISPAVMPEGANVTVDNQNGTAPWARNKKLGKGQGKGKNQNQRQLQPSGASAPVITMSTIGSELFCICLVTCYSEGEESIKGTLDSISATSYSDSRKLLFVVCDGMITGSGEKMSTPDICVGLLEADPRFGNPVPMGYVAVGLGKKKENRAMVYAGHYTAKGRRTPTIIIVKCGTEGEAETDKKPGNRGKRDSQLVLMNFFSRVTYNDRMTPLDYDLFRKIQVLMGVTPDFFEVTLMVDADTRVSPDSITQLVNCMHHDNMIMGVCGETRIANKTQSWVTTIQVYEYFISHHLAKAFESVFGGVTCLPGCFSMYRLKARKVTDDDWVPLITKPEIVREYSQSEVTTLHQKNLLLLGEDRFLTTILLRTFPNRKMMFCPQAKCRTVCPDTFSILLSQRRRWINSTIHNLMELVLVQNLCGTFCFSMQFVVFMDLLGTVVLPVALGLMYWLIAEIAIHPPSTFEQAIPVMLLISAIGLPAVLILITTGKVVYVFWMLIYLLALPIWNFVLPVYSFWHFDDFSWGETRKVEGEGKQKGHDDASDTLAEGTQVPMRRWEDWERSRLRKLKREEKRRREMERLQIGGGGPFRGQGVPGRDTVYSMAISEFNEGSEVDPEDDRWGAQVGGYNEHSSQWAPPPATLLLPGEEVIQSAESVGGDELSAMLERGFEDRPHRDSQGTMSSGPFSDRHQSRYLLVDGGAAPPSGRFESYTPLSTRTPSPGPHAVLYSEMHPPASPSMNALDWGGHHSFGGRSRTESEEGLMRGASTPGSSTPAAEWGPLGPLDPQHNPRQPPGSGRRI